MPGNDSGLSKTRAIEPPGQRGILGGGLRGGGPGRPPFWRTPIKPRKGLGPVPLEINTLDTHYGPRQFPSTSLSQGCQPQCVLSVYF